MKKKTACNNVSPDNKFDELNELQTTIDAASSELHDNSVAIRDMLGEKDSLKQSVKIFIQNYKDSHPSFDFSSTKINVEGDFNKSRLNKEELEQFDAIRSRLEDIEKRLIEAKEKQKLLQDREACLLSSMAALNVNYSTECLHYLHQKQSEAERKVSAINEAIAAQEKIIEQNMSTCQVSISETVQLREEMLADIALGIVEESELASIDEQLKKTADTVAESTGKLNDDLTLVRQTIAGLKRKLAASEKELDAVKFARTSAERRFLYAEAEKIGKNYAEAANLLAANFRRLLALNSIIEDKNYPGIEAGDPRRIFIPTFAVDCHKCLGDREITEVEQAAQYHYLETDKQIEVERFAQVGIVI